MYLSCLPSAGSLDIRSRKIKARLVRANTMLVTQALSQDVTLLACVPLNQRGMGNAPLIGVSLYWGTRTVQRVKSGSVFWTISFG